MVVLEELDENNNIIVKPQNDNQSKNIMNEQNINLNSHRNFPFTGLHQQQVPIFLPNMMPQFPGAPFSFNIQMGPNVSPQQMPPNMFIFRQQ